MDTFTHPENDLPVPLPAGIIPDAAAFKGWFLSDIFVQSIMLLIWAISAIFQWDGTGFMYGYFIVGGWQLISTAIRSQQHIPKWKGGRKIYYWLLLFILASVVVIPVIGFISAYLWLFFTPLMAIYYYLVCIQEYTQLSTTHLPDHEK